MSTQQEITEYQFNFNYSDPVFNGGFGFQISGQAGFGDAEAFALQDAIMAALAKTPILASGGALFKSLTVSTQYQTNANPQSFT